MSPRTDSFYIVEESYTLPFQINNRLPYHHFWWVKGLMEPYHHLKWVKGLIGKHRLHFLDYLSSWNDVRCVGSAVVAFFQTEVAQRAFSAAMEHALLASWISVIAPERKVDNADDAFLFRSCLSFFFANLWCHRLRVSEYIQSRAVIKVVMFTAPTS